MAKSVKKPAKKLAAKKTIPTKAKPKAPAKPIKKSTPVKKSAVKPASPAKPATPKIDKGRFTLYGVNLSGPAYAVALMLSLAQYPFSYIHVNLREGQHKMPDFLVKNRFAQVPALRDGQNYYAQSSAILDHLAEALGKFNGKTPLEQNRIREWQFWLWDKLNAPIYRLRGRNRGFRQFGDELRQMYEAEAKAALSFLDGELSKSEWLVGKKPTIADINVYSVVRYAPEALIDLQPYPHLLAWKARLEALPGFGPPEQILPTATNLL